MDFFHLLGGPPRTFLCVMNFHTRANTMTCAHTWNGGLSRTQERHRGKRLRVVSTPPTKGRRYMDSLSHPLSLSLQDFYSRSALRLYPTFRVFYLTFFTDVSRARYSLYARQNLYTRRCLQPKVRREGESMDNCSTRSKRNCNLLFRAFFRSTKFWSERGIFCDHFGKVFNVTSGFCQRLKSVEDIEKNQTFHWWFNKCFSRKFEWTFCEPL